MTTTGADRSDHLTAANRPLDREPWRGIPVPEEPLPLPDLPPERTSAVIYGASAVDDRGRVADRVVLRALGWPVGRRLDIRGSRPCRQHQVTGQGHLRIRVTDTDCVLNAA
jgi:hypothetical protein